MNEKNDLLKFITCGSVDDGKSTLIGHLLYDAKLLYADQKEALLLDSKVGSRGGAIDYSLLLDGLLAEREQGITIDVAYRYFTTESRSFICADTPGHEEYTRNMACGASFADLAIILVDATQGVLTQTRRHARICALMGIRYFVFAVNKMDLIHYDEVRFNEIAKQIQELERELNLENVVIIPVSATEGDNVTKKSDAMPWYTGKALLPYLETVDVTTNAAVEQGFYLPVQRVCRPDHTFRGFEGQIESGSVSIGDTIRVLPSGESAEVKSILVADHEEKSAFTGQPVTIQLSREVDVSRGSVLEKDSGLELADSFQAELLWMDDAELTVGKNFLLQLGTRQIPAILSKIEYRIDINTGEHEPADTLQKNEIALVDIAVTEPIVLAPFSAHRTQGELILIDRITNSTAAAGVVRTIGSSNAARFEATPAMRSALNWQTPLAVVFAPQDNVTSAAIAEAEYTLVRSGRHTYLYTPEATDDAASTTQHLLNAGLIVLVAAKSEDAASALANLPHAKAWSDLANGATDAATIANTILHATLLDATVTPNNWVI
ncbi:sulfate adenylyltransferase subunit 1 [uncultured Selenomonas sp.]|uniref:sulfate adenylyltransferase subunit 1 n=1 Tax=uncultured Selenomonas sp. TaxID=159275 RepID=UPI0025D97467|nr:GTP-binding protein [uncultured Selenomonas sp.]